MGLKLSACLEMSPDPDAFKRDGVRREMNSNIKLADFEQTENGYSCQFMSVFCLKDRDELARKCYFYH